MYKGFYQLTSGMLSQGRRLDVIANNMSNVSTAGYKADRYTDSTAFREVMISRIGNKDKRNAEELGRESYILAPDELYTDHTQGSFEETEMPLDFAIQGEGYYFAISREGAEIGYTRAGSFSLDDEGYLCLPGQGRVMDPNYQPIQLPTDKIYVDKTGAIYTDENRNLLGTLGVFQFADTAELERNERGLFVGGQPQAGDNGYSIIHKFVERSNANMVHEMVAMMTAQRALQSAAEMSKIYDQVMTRDATEVGRLG